MGNLESAVASLATGTGMAPEKARDFVTAGAAMYQRAADRAVAAAGLSEDERDSFYRAAVEFPQGRFYDALQQLVLCRNAAPMRALAASWKEAVARGVEAGR
jgi:hypothetical protein